MWSKPSEFGSGELHPPGYEVVAHYTDPITPAVAIAAWHDSDSHNDMILNRKTWRGMTWSAMGVAMSTHYAVVWFSE